MCYYERSTLKDDKDYFDYNRSILYFCGDNLWDLFFQFILADFCSEYHY